ncbi:hypothetical protein Hanom_Chr10g00931681 [Helianthus anomalus]
MSLYRCSFLSFSTDVKHVFVSVPKASIVPVIHQVNEVKVAMLLCFPLQAVISMKATMFRLCYFISFVFIFHACVFFNFYLIKTHDLEIMG